MAKTPKKTYVVRAGDIGYNADIANKAQAYLSGGTYTPGQAIDTNWWGTGGGKAQMYGNNKTYKGMAMGVVRSNGKSGIVKVTVSGKGIKKQIVLRGIAL